MGTVSNLWTGLSQLVSPSSPRQELVMVVVNWLSIKNSPSCSDGLHLDIWLACTLTLLSMHI